MQKNRINWIGIHTNLCLIENELKALDPRTQGPEATTRRIMSLKYMEREIKRIKQQVEEHINDA